jgi:hypothetical protein
MSSPSDDIHQFHTKYPPRFYEIVREALKDEPDSVAFHIPDDVLYKFARLIAEECADIAMKQHHSMSFEEYDELEEYDRGCEDTASIISGQLNRLFKVTE